MATATQEAKNKCLFCGKTFDTAEDARQHEKNCTRGTASPAIRAQKLPRKKK